MPRVITRSIAPLLLALLFLPPAAAIAGDRDGPSPKEVKQMIEFGIKLGKQGLWKEALHRWQQALCHDPDNAQLHNNIAVALESQGDLEGARESYKRAAELDDNARYVKRNIANFEELFTALEQYEKEYREPPADEAGDGEPAGDAGVAPDGDATGDEAGDGEAAADGDAAAEAAPGDDEEPAEEIAATVAGDSGTETGQPAGDRTAEETAEEEE